MDEMQKTISLADFIEAGNSPGGLEGDPRVIKASQHCLPKATDPADAVSGHPCP